LQLDHDEVDELPAYTPSLQLLTLCRRKMEYTSEGRKARSRSWEIVWLLLDGTALRMYKPTSAESQKFEKEWEEKYCTRRETDLTKSTIVEEDTTRSYSSEKVPVNDESSTPTILFTSHPSLSSVLSRTPQKSYSIQNATCTRPSHYFKRNFVLEFTSNHNDTSKGAQFLVQLNSLEELNTWVEAIKIVQPLALDIDERSMPELEPYRRRREGEAAGEGEVTTEQLDALWAEDTLPQYVST
jgi:hypothetical protein